MQGSPELLTGRDSAGAPAIQDMTGFPELGARNRGRDQSVQSVLSHGHFFPYPTVTVMLELGTEGWAVSAHQALTKKRVLGQGLG